MSAGCTSFGAGPATAGAQNITDPEQTDAIGGLRDVVQRLSVTLQEGMVDLGRRMTRAEGRLGIDPDAETDED